MESPICQVSGTWFFVAQLVGGKYLDLDASVGLLLHQFGKVVAAVVHEVSIRIQLGILEYIGFRRNVVGDCRCRILRRIRSGFRLPRLEEDPGYPGCFLQNREPSGTALPHGGKVTNRNPGSPGMLP